MPCDTRRRREQSIEDRKKEIKTTVDKLSLEIIKRTVRPVVGANGAITFVGWKAENRNDITDACAYRRLLVQGNQMAINEIKRAEALAGRTVNKQVVAQGVHSHDGGMTWHNKG